MAKRAANSGGTGLGRTPGEAGLSRVPAPPHMISGTIRLSIGASNFVMAAIPRDKAANTILNRGLGPKADVAHQIPDIGEGFGYISGLHRQHILYRRAAQLLLQQRHQVHKLFRVVIADIVEPRRGTPGALIGSGNPIHKARYYTGNVIDIGAGAPPLATRKQPDRLAFIA